MTMWEHSLSPGADTSKNGEAILNKAKQKNDCWKLRGQIIGENMAMRQPFHNSCIVVGL